MKHYYHPMSRAVTTHWMLAELDVSHRGTENTEILLSSSVRVYLKLLVRRYI